MISITNTKCITCGAPLKIQDNESALRCGHCGSEYISEKKNGGDLIQLNKLSPGLDRVASELGIKRLKEELAELDAQAIINLENLENKKKQEILEIEKRKNISLSSPAIENLKNELNILENEKTHDGLKASLNISLGLVGGFVTFIVSIFVFFFCTAVGAFLLSVTLNINLPNYVYSFLYLGQIIMAFIFIVGFSIYVIRKQKKTITKLSSRLSQLAQEIKKQQESITGGSAKQLSLLNEQIENQKLVITVELEAAKEYIKKVISERQDQLEKHYNKVKY